MKWHCAENSPPTLNGQYLVIEDGFYSIAGYEEQEDKNTPSWWHSIEGFIFPDYWMHLPVAPTKD